MPGRLCQGDYAREIMMDQPKFSIGPYELFSSIIAGAPLL
jgi:hypothetical protein